jgi:hypothetical protein
MIFPCMLLWVECYVFVYVEILAPKSDGVRRWALLGGNSVVKVEHS